MFVSVSLRPRMFSVVCAPFWQARCNGTTCLRVLAFTGIPAVISIRAISVCPFCAAKCSAVMSSTALAFTLTPGAASSALTAACGVKGLWVPFRHQPHAEDADRSQASVHHCAELRASTVSALGACHAWLCDSSATSARAHFTRSNWASTTTASRHGCAPPGQPRPLDARAPAAACQLRSHRYPG